MSRHIGASRSFQVAVTALGLFLTTGCGSSDTPAIRASTAQQLIDRLLDPTATPEARSATVEGDLSRSELTTVDQLLLASPGPITVAIDNPEDRGSALEFEFQLTAAANGENLVVGSWHGVVCECDDLRLSRQTYCGVLDDLSDEPCQR